MGCLGVGASALFLSTLCVYVIMQALVVDWREGAVAYIGTGEPRAFTAAGTGGGSRIARLPSGAALYTLEGPSEPRMSFLLVHDLSAHGGAMSDLALALFKQCEGEGFVCAAYAVDLPGHGHCGDRCGKFTMQQLVDTVREASAWIRNATHEGAVFTVGQGMGAEVALHAGSGFQAITGTIANGLLMPAELELRPQVSLFRGWVGELLSVAMGQRLVCTAALVDFRRLYDAVDCAGHSTKEDACTWRTDAAAYHRALLDPHSQWFYTLPALRSLYTHTPPVAASAHGKPILVIAGGQDRAVPLEHVREGFQRLGGQKTLRYTMAAGHMLLQQEPVAVGKLLVSYANAVLSGTHVSIQPESPYLAL